MRTVAPAATASVTAAWTESRWPAAMTGPYVYVGAALSLPPGGVPAAGGAA